MTGVDTLRAIIARSHEFAVKSTEFDVNRFEHHFSPSRELPEVIASDVLELSHAERLKLLKATKDIYEHRFNGASGARCWCAPFATVQIPGAALASLLIEESMFHHGGIHHLRWEAWHVSCQVNWWCFKGFDFHDDPENRRRLGSYRHWINCLTRTLDDTVSDWRKLVEFKEREVAAANVLLQRLRISSPHLFIDQAVKNRNAELKLVIDAANSGQALAAAKIDLITFHADILEELELPYEACRALDRSVDLKGFNTFSLGDIIGPFGYLDETTQPTLTEWVDKPHLSANSHPSLNEWMESREWHDGLALLGGIPTRASWIHEDYPGIQRAHELLAQAIKSALDSCKGCNPNGDAYRFIQGILRLYGSEDNVASTVLALREIAGRLRGPYAATLSKLYMFGFKVERDPQEALHWVALSGEPERFVANSNDGNRAELKRSWLIWSFARFLILEGDETEATAWANLSASNPIFSSWHSVFSFIDHRDESWNDKGWRVASAGCEDPSKTSGVVRSYQILRELLSIAKSERNYAPSLPFGLHERIYQLPPYEDFAWEGLHDPDYHYIAAFQFYFRWHEHAKQNCWFYGGGEFPEAPIDLAESFVHVVLLYDLEKAVACCEDAESALSILKLAVSNDGIGRKEMNIWWMDKNYLYLVEGLLEVISHEDVLRAIKRLQSTRHV